ncbi:MAG TPA: EAL domain-containing response regulator [Terracidiphilus sp.]|nr:EAL domain-containing response regulator [Terracidiphilus sp.]
MANADRILVIDDDEVVCSIVAALARALSLECATIRDPATFLDYLTPDTSFILLDLMMPGMDGIEVLRLLGERRSKARILLMSGMDKRVLETAEKLAQNLGLSVIGHMQKPVPLDALRAMLQALTTLGAPETLIEAPPPLISDDQLRQATERDEFMNYYQPQISLSTGQITGFEALARWRHPEFGIIPPESFIARVEALGLIDKLCWSTAELALRDMREYGLLDGNLPHISLNASMHSLHDLAFPDSLVRMAQRYGFPTELIAVEVTESGLARQLSRTLDVLTRLRMKGFKLSIDDFGTGYAMMRQLQNVPATELKIDKSLVEHVQGHDSERVMVEKVIELGHELGMEVMAEGVATQEQFDALRYKGCDGAQGFLISRPLPAEELAVWVENYQAHHQQAL